MIYFLTILLLLSLAFNVKLFLRWSTLDNLITDHVENLEKCLDGINSVYAKVGTILQMPLATNDPNVLQIHRELKKAHDYLLEVANLLTK